MLADVLDFLEFSENNLSWQRRREIRKVEREAEQVEFEEKDKYLEPQYRAQLIEGAEYRFDVSLSQRIRYAGLVAFVTTIQWCALTLRKRMVLPLPECPKSTNKEMHILATLNVMGSCGFDRGISDISDLIHVRNCIVHAAGLVNSYEHASTLPASITRLSGIKICNTNFLGPSIEIAQGAVEAYVGAANEWLPKLDEVCTARGILKS